MGTELIQVCVCVCVDVYGCVRVIRSHAMVCSTVRFVCALVSVPLPLALVQDVYPDTAAALRAARHFSPDVWQAQVTQAWGLRLPGTQPSGQLQHVW
jgi:hypothetical protein